MWKMTPHRVGHRCTTKQGYEIVVVDYEGYEKVIVNFVGTNIHVVTRWKRVEECAVENPYHKSFYGVGFIGEGKYSSSENNKITKAIVSWSDMLKRCYSEAFLREYPTYLGCKVEESWHNFQNFAKWHVENFITGWQLDKDLLSGEEKIYSENTCCYLPQQINLALARLSTSGLGVSCDPRNKVPTYTARFKNKSLGTYKTEVEARNVYNKYSQEKFEDLIAHYKDVLKPEILEKLQIKAAKRRKQIEEEMKRGDTAV